MSLLDSYCVLSDPNPQIFEPNSRSHGYRDRPLDPVSKSVRSQRKRHLVHRYG